MKSKFVTTPLAIVCLLALAATLISLIETNLWFIRVLDFIREPVFYASLVLAVLCLFTAKAWRWWLVGGFVLVAAIQFYRFGAYTPVVGKQIAVADKGPSGSCFRALALNVRMDNTQYGRVAELIARQKPDLLLLMETNGEWVTALEAELSAYPYRLTKPLDNHYGMAFASKIPVDRARMVANTSADTPTLYATLTPPGGRTIEFIGLHPRPPVPGQSTETRDANIARAGAKTPDNLNDVFVMGDFNDVPWSHTTSRFRREGGFLDPRIGRGTYPTFPADHTWLGWPIDLLLVKSAIHVERFEVLDAVGSDHRPVLARLCVEPADETQ